MIKIRRISAITTLFFILGLMATTLLWWVFKVQFVLIYIN